MSVGISLGAGLAIAGGIGAAGSIAGSVIGANAAGSAADKQVAQDNKALDYTKQAEAPYLDFGSTSVSKLMDSLNNGTFGPGSLPAFQLPDKNTVEQTPGYQFALEQGEQGISRQQAAAGGSFTGGTLKAGAGYAQGLASTTYQQQVSNSLAAYQAQLAKQAQEYQQLITPVTIGANAASGTSTNVSNLMQSIGNSQAAGTVGQANAITGGISGATNSVTQGLLLSSLLPGGGTNPAIGSMAPGGSIGGIPIAPASQGGGFLNDEGAWVPG